MKFIHLSDFHFLTDAQTVHGIDTRARLETAVSSITANFADAAFCMVTGDLTERAELDAYRDVKDILDRLPIPWHPLMGNHDVRAQARTVMGDLPWHADGFLQYELQTDAGRFIVLDSVHEGHHEGHLCDTRLGWLTARLDAARDAGQDVYLFMHHPPFDIGLGWLDAMKMQDGDDLAAVLGDYSNIRHMFMGHVHRPCHGSWNGIPFSIVRAVAHQAALYSDGTGTRFIEENPAYSVVSISGDGVVINDHSFLEEGRPRD